MGDITPISEDRGSPRPNGEPIRFGAFELELRTCEVRKGSRPIKIVGQPYAVLVTLVERPGEIITREELQQKLWPSDTFVDFEHGLNAAVNKLREALGDNADNPRYIETLPRRGYRFIGQIQPPSAPAVAEQKREDNPRQASSWTSRWNRWTVITAVVALGLILVAGWLWAPSPTRNPTVLSYRKLTSDGQLKGPPPCSGGWSRVVTDGPRVYFSRPSATV